MNGGEPSGALHDLGTLFSHGILGGLTDRQLLERFANPNDPSAADAFTVLIERHGPMVWGVCRRLLFDKSDASDAFQATFLVLVQRAPAVKVDDSLGPWLYGVSRRVAARARATSLRRRARETGGVEALAAPSLDPEHAERLEILDEEISRLSGHQRAAVVLCDLEGIPHGEAARRLGCPVGTVESRLSRGRQRLRDRLMRRGFDPSAAALFLDSARGASVALPAVLIKNTARFVATSPASVAVPATVAAFAQGVIQAMWFAKIKPLAAVATALIVGTAGVTVIRRQQTAPDEAREQAKTAPPAVGGTGAAALPAPGLAANRALAREQLALIEQALDTLNDLARIGRVSFADPAFALWERRRLETMRSSGAGKAEILAALEKYINSLTTEEAIAKNQQESARATVVSVLDVKFRRMEAEIWLNEEKAR